MDDLTLDADLDHHLFRTNSHGSRPFYAAAYTTTTHYLLAEGDVLNHQDLRDLYYDRRSVLAAALDLPKTIGADYDLIGLTYLGLVNALG